MILNNTVDMVLVITAIGGLMKYIITNSKCSNINLCYGLVKLQRDTQAEVELEEYHSNNNNHNNPQSSSDINQMTQELV